MVPLACLFGCCGIHDFVVHVACWFLLVAACILRFVSASFGFFPLLPCGIGVFSYTLFFTLRKEKQPDDGEAQ
jgi:hypothetical protein